MLTHTWKFSDLVLAILDLIMKRVQRIMSGMEPSFNTNIWVRHRTLDKRLLEATGVLSILF